MLRFRTWFFLLSAFVLAGLSRQRRRAIQPHARCIGRDAAFPHQRRPAPPEGPFLANPLARWQAGALHPHPRHRRRRRQPSLDRSSLRDQRDKPRQLTFSPPADKRGEHNAQWAPDNSAIFFLAKRGDHTQLFRLDLRGGEASPYDLKILPPVDVSKDKGRHQSAATRAPESSEKKDDKKPADQKAGAATHRRRRLLHQR